MTEFFVEKDYILPAYYNSQTELYLVDFFRPISSISFAASAEITSSSFHCLSVNDSIAFANVHACPGPAITGTVLTVVNNNKFTVNVNSTAGAKVDADSVFGEIISLSAQTFTLSGWEFATENNYLVYEAVATSSEGQKIVEVDGNAPANKGDRFVINSPPFQSEILDSEVGPSCFSKTKYLLKDKAIAASTADWYLVRTSELSGRGSPVALGSVQKTENKLTLLWGSFPPTRFLYELTGFVGLQSYLVQRGTVIYE